MNQRIVIDTNVYLSRFLRPTSVPGRAVERAWDSDTTLVSSATLLELRGVLGRKKFARYIDPSEIEPYFSRVWDAADHVHVNSKIQACRHAKDDKFLALAVDGHANLILSGDSDLLALNPFRDIPIVSPMQYLAED